MRSALTSSAIRFFCAEPCADAHRATPGMSLNEFCWLAAMAFVGTFAIAGIWGMAS